MLEFCLLGTLWFDPPSGGPLLGWLAVKTAGLDAAEAAWMLIISRKGIFRFKKLLKTFLRNYHKI